MPAVLAGGLLVFIDVIESFGVPFVLAEDKPVLAVEAYKLFVGETGGNPASAGVLGVLLIICTTIALLMQRHYLGRRRFSTAARRTPPELVVKPWLRRLACAYSWGVVLDRPRTVLRHHRDLLHGVPRPGDASEPQPQQLPRPLQSVLAAADQHAHPVHRRRHPGRDDRRPHRLSPSPAFARRISDLLDVIAMTPFAVAGTVLAIGLIISFNSGWLVLTGGWLILVLAWVVRKIPFNVRASAAILHQIDPSLEEASINLGVSPLMTFVRLTVPLMMGGVIGGMVLTWVTVASELSPPPSSSTVARGRR